MSSSSVHGLARDDALSGPMRMRNGTSGSGQALANRNDASGDSDSLP